MALFAAEWFSRRVALEYGPHQDFHASLEQYRRQGESLHDLTVSNPTEVGIDYAWPQLRAAFSSAPFERYAPESAGSQLAREAIVRHLHPCRAQSSDGFADLGLSTHYRADRLILTASTSEAYSYLFRLLCDPGESVLVPEPSYPLFEQLAAFDAVRLVPYRLDYDGAWFIDFDSLREGMRVKPKAVLLVAPNNPTGSCVTPVEFEQLMRLGVPLIADHVFSPYVSEHSGLQSLAPGAVDEGLLFTLDGLSKRCGLPQLKLAWIAVSGNNKNVERAVLGLHHVADAFLSPNAITQGALEGILTASSITLRSIRRRLRLNLEALMAAIKTGVPVTCCHYQGGWSAMLRFPNTQSDDEWAHWCLRRGVLLQPGWLYDCSLPSTLIASLLTPADEFASALSVLAQALRAQR